jgi:hypothetical protein
LPGCRHARVVKPRMEVLGNLWTSRVMVPKDASVSGDPSYSLAFCANCSGLRDHHTICPEVPLPQLDGCPVLRNRRIPFAVL